MWMFMWRLHKKIYNDYCTQKYFFIEKYFDSWDPNIHGPFNYLQNLYVAALIEERGNEKHYALAMFRNGISKNTRSYYKGAMNDGIPLSSFDCEMASKVKKNWRSTFGKTLRWMVILLNNRMMKCLRIGQKDLHLYWSHLMTCSILKWTYYLSSNLYMKWSALIILSVTIFLKYDIVVTLTSIMQIFNSIKPLN